MHLQSDYTEILPVARALKKQVTRAFESKAALSSSWWAELTVDFADELLRPGRFFDGWLRPLGVHLDVDLDAQRIEMHDIPTELRQRFEMPPPLLDRLRRTQAALEQEGRRIQRAIASAEKELSQEMKHRAAAQAAPLTKRERERRREAISDLKRNFPAGANVAVLHQRIAEHDELRRKRRDRIIGALIEVAAKWPEDYWLLALAGKGYWPFAVAARALWHRVPPRSRGDLVTPPAEIAETLAAWRRGALAQSAVQKTMDRLDKLGSVDAGAGPFDPDPGGTGP